MILGTTYYRPLQPPFSLPHLPSLVSDPPTSTLTLPRRIRVISRSTRLFSFLLYFFFFISFPLYISPGDKAFIGLAIHHYASLTRRCPDKLNVYPANFRPIIDNDYPPPRQYFERKSLLFARTCVAYMVDSLTRYPKTISMLCRSRIAKSLRTINVMSDAIPLDSKFPVDASPYD